MDLIPGLAKACRRDMTKFCSTATGNDQVIPCLKKNIEVRQVIPQFEGICCEVNLFTANSVSLPILVISSLQN